MRSMVYLSVIKVVIHPFKKIHKPVSYILELLCRNTFTNFYFFTEKLLFKYFIKNLMIVNLITRTIYTLFYLKDLETFHVSKLSLSSSLKAGIFSCSSLLFHKIKMLSRKRTIKTKK